ncbi:MAG: LysM peptidoglycan-binding domain-containing protein, partial [Chloroflexi bacterium]|nr:LysM peptidoglycan-binding domain-containing protein [Chloroflexota bacterium]
MRRKGIALLLVLSLLFPVSVVNAQTTPDNPIYIVQNGDTLGVIALRFGVSVTDLINANNISDPNQIAIGTQLIIPGLKDVSGYLVTQTVPIGESLYSLSLRYQVSTDLLVRLNRITSANEIYAGTNLVIPQVLEEAQLKARAALAPGESLLEAAVLQNENPWKLSEINRFQGNWDALPGETIYSPTDDDNTEISSISPLIKQIVVDPLPLVQGETTSIRVTT